MDVRKAQREVRTTYMGGFVGQLVSAVLWAISAALGTWGSPESAIGFLVIAGMFIFPLTQLILRAMGRPTKLSAQNPMDQLARQTALLIPLNFPLVAAAGLYRLEWFYPAMMIVVGSHYLPFVFLYGMTQFAVLGGALWALAVAIAFFSAERFAVGGWLTALVLAVFAFVGRKAASE